MSAGEDVYDVGRFAWCGLCQAEHSPCEENDDGSDHFAGAEPDDTPSVVAMLLDSVLAVDQLKRGRGRIECRINGRRAS